MKRIVTGRAADGRDGIISSGSVDPVAAMPGSRNETRLCWSTTGPIVVPRDAAEPMPEFARAPQAPGDSRFLLLTFPPRATTPVHVTPTCDYVVIVMGELWLVMDNGDECRLGVGDSVVQNGTLHAWENRAEMPCTIAAVMIGAEIG